MEIEYEFIRKRIGNGETENNKKQKQTGKEKHQNIIFRILISATRREKKII